MSITLETVLAFALKDQVVMDQLGPALRNDLVTTDPYQRSIAEFADDFLINQRKLPGPGDWEGWLESLSEGTQRDGCREMLGRLLAVDVSGYDARFFADEAVGHLQRGAAQVAKAKAKK